MNCDLERLQKEENARTLEYEQMVRLGKDFRPYQRVAESKLKIARNMVRLHTEGCVKCKT